MSDDGDALLDAVTRLLPLVCGTLDTLAVIARQNHPGRLPDLVALIGTQDTALRDALAAFVAAPAPESLAAFRAHLAEAAERTLRSCDGLREAATTADPRIAAYRALRHTAVAQEALYPLAAALPTVSRWFLNPPQQQDAALLDAFGRPADGTGVMHAGNDRGERGGFSLYVPENYDPARKLPLVMALHGGAGHGRSFLWTWLREARGRGLILVSPTAIGDTWSLMEPDVDAQNLARILDLVRQRWAVDETRLLLTGMSDGGTFTLLAGLHEESPFTHLAPVAASFHPLLLTMSEPARMAGLPVYLTHGALDWMFPVGVGRTAQRALAAAGARVTYREIADLSHTYPREENDRIVDWLLETDGAER